MAFTVRLTRIRQLSASTRDFRFVREDGVPLDYQPGQFYRFVFTDAEGEFERSYSLCNYEDLYGTNLDLLISRVEGGRATRLLFDCEEGLIARVTGPYGRLVLPAKPPPRLLLVATSVGLAPCMPILRQLESLNYARVLLLLGVRDHSECIYADLLRDYAEKHDYFDLKFCLSRAAPARSDEAAGHVTEQLAAIQPDPAQDHLLLCGNPQMIDDIWKSLKAEGFRPKQVIREKYVFARERQPASRTLSEAQKQLIADKVKKHT